MCARYQTIIEDGTIYVEVDVGRLEIGPLSDVLDHFGETHTKEYSEFEKQRYGGEISFADEGMETDVRRTIENMTHSAAFVSLLQSRPLEESEGGNTGMTRRMLVFLGGLGENLDNGVR